MPLQAQSAANGFRQALVRVRARSIAGGGPRLVNGEAKRRVKPWLTPTHLPVAVGQRDGVVANPGLGARGCRPTGRLMVQQSAWYGRGLRMGR